MKIKCGDIIYLPYINEHFAEVGPGKVETKMYEVYPIEPCSEDVNLYVYAKESIWIPKSAIAEHYTVRSHLDFHKAWISLGYQPEVEGDEVRFRKLFEHEHNDDGAVDSLSSNSDTCSDIRSNCSWSTIESGSNLSFVTDSHEPGEICEDPVCDFCKQMGDNDRWFRYAWQPRDPTESAVKSVIENIEEKYT